MGLACDECRRHIDKKVRAMGQHKNATTALIIRDLQVVYVVVSGWLKWAEGNAATEAEQGQGQGIRRPG
jgi:hypothetical protein